MLKFQLGDDIRSGQVVAIEHGWVETFFWLPHRTIRQKWIWLKKGYIRRVWVYTGFVDEPETQYANIFDVLSNKDEV